MNKEFTVLYFDILNKNNRIYRRESIDIDKLNVELEHKPMLGQFGFPEDRFGAIKNATHEVKKFKYDENDNLAADITLLDNESGAAVKEMLECKIPIVLRTRAIGKVNDNNEVEITELLSLDFISKQEDSF